MIETNRNCLCCGIRFVGTTGFCSPECRAKYERERWGENGTHINRFVAVNRGKPAVQRRNSKDNRD